MVRKIIINLVKQYKKLRNIVNVYFNCLYNRIKPGKKWIITGRFYITPFRYSLSRRNNIFIGDNFTCRNVLNDNAFGIIQSCTFRIEPNAILQIGDNVGISGSAISCMKNIVIGDNTLIGTGCIICDNDAHNINAMQRKVNYPPPQWGMLLLGTMFLLVQDALY